MTVFSENSLLPDFKQKYITYASLGKVRKKEQKEVRDIGYRKSQDMFYAGETPQKRREKVLGSSLYKELEEYQNAGLSLWLNGRPSTSYGIANYVREESDYMRDYRFNQKNEICGIGFDKVGKMKL